MTLLVTVATIQSCPNYTGGQIMETISRHRNWTLHCHFQTCSSKR